MSIKVRKYKKSDYKLWDEFVENSNNGTIFHLRSFLSYHIDQKFNDHSLIFEKKGNIIAVFPAVIEEKEKKRILFSHPGASFGGFVYSKLFFRDVEKIIVLIEHYSKEQGFNEIFFIQTPRIYHSDYCETFNYLLHLNDFKTVENYISSAIKTSGTLDETLHQIQKRKRRYIKKILSNQDFHFEWNNNYDEYYPILLENKARHGAKPTHTLEELKKLVSILPKKFHLLMLYYNNKPIGGTLNFVANSKTAVIFYNMINYQYESFQPAALQIYETIKWANQSGFDFLDFGVSQNPNTKNPLSPNPSLIRFKEQFGSKGMIRKAFHKTLI